MASSREGNQRDSLAHQIFVLVLMVAIPLAVGFGGSQLIDDETDGWYQQADRARGLRRTGFSARCGRRSTS